MKKYKGCVLSRSKSKAGAWCTIVTFPNGQREVYFSFADAREKIDRLASSSKLRHKALFV